MPYVFDLNSLAKGGIAPLLLMAFLGLLGWRKMLGESLLYSHRDVLLLHAGQEELASMAAAFATLPCKVLWRLTPREAPDAAAVPALNLGNNTRVSLERADTLWLQQCPYIQGLLFGVDPMVTRVNPKPYPLSARSALVLGILQHSKMVIEPLCTCLISP